MIPPAAPQPQNNHNTTQEETLAPRTAPHPVQYTRTPGTCATARRDSLTHSLTHSLTRSLARSLARSLTHSLTHSFIHSFSQSFIRSFRLSQHSTVAVLSSHFGSSRLVSNVAVHVLPFPRLSTCSGAVGRVFPTATAGVVQYRVPYFFALARSFCGAFSYRGGQTCFPGRDCVRLRVHCWIALFC